MSGIATTLGLRASSPLSQPPSMAASYIIFHFFFAYTVLSSRLPKLYYRLDHNVSPREDLTKYGQKAVESGKITQKQLDQLKRLESAHANSVEHFPLFFGAIIWAQIAGLPTTEINGSALAYTLARVAYAVTYIWADREALSRPRGLMWWTSNIICLRLIWLGGKAINSKLIDV